MSYDLIAFDMDGTLLDSSKKIRKDSFEMIKKAVAAGKIVCLSTGRSMPELTSYPELDFMQYLICISGALVIDNQTKKEIYTRAVPEETAFQLFERVKDKDVMIHFHSNQSVVQKDKVYNMKHFQMANYQPMFEKITVKPENIIEYYRQTKIPLYKINIYSTSPAAREQLLPEISNLDLTFAYSEITSIECSAKGVSKGSGLKMLCQKLNIPLERTIAVGDADNDLEILKTAGLAVAMGNANENVKKTAAVIVKDNDHGGCAQVIEEYLLKD